MSELTLEQKLQIPFPPDDIEWRVQSSGVTNKKAWALIMPYVTNRAIQDRLDNVFGVFGWENEFREIQFDGKLSFLCGITIYNERMPSKDGFRDSVTKWDGADTTDVESFKGGLSNSMKRSGVELGIGRYLYKLDTYFAELSTEKHKGKFMVKIKDEQTSRTRYYYNAPQLPPFALPENFEYKAEKMNGKNPEPKKDVEPLEEQIKSELTGRDMTTEAEACKNNAELAVWWGNLSSEYKKEGSPVIAIKDARKLAIKVEQETEVKPDGGQTPAQEALQHVEETKIKEEGIKYTFESLKINSIATLKQISKEMGIIGYSKMDKTNLITSIIKKRG